MNKTIPLIEHTGIYDGLCSTIGNTFKYLTADEAQMPSGAEFSRLTVKCRTIGTNTYIGIGTNNMNFRFTAAQQAVTFIAPQINGSVVPFLIGSLKVTGDVAGGAGVLEFFGLRVYRNKEV